MAKSKIPGLSWHIPVSRAKACTEAGKSCGEGAFEKFGLFDRASQKICLALLMFMD